MQGCKDKNNVLLYDKMNELTGIKDVDNIIYDFEKQLMYSDMQEKNETDYNYKKVIKEIEEKTFDYLYANARLKWGPTQLFKGKLHKYFENMTFHDVWDVSDKNKEQQMRDPHKDEVIYLYNNDSPWG